MSCSPCAAPHVLTTSPDPASNQQPQISAIPTLGIRYTTTCNILQPSDARTAATYRTRAVSRRSRKQHPARHTSPTACTTQSARRAGSPEAGQVTRKLGRFPGSWARCCFQTPSLLRSHLIRYQAATWPSLGQPLSCASSSSIRACPPPVSQPGTQRRSAKPHPGQGVLDCRPGGDVRQPHAVQASAGSYQVAAASAEGGARRVCAAGRAAARQCR
jgi:hypothetical protein